MFWEGLGEFFGNYMLISAILSWFVAQIIKIFTGLYQHGKLSLTKIIFRQEVCQALTLPP